MSARRHPFQSRLLQVLGIFLIAALVGTISLFSSQQASRVHDWDIHDLKRPQPPLVTPGTAATQQSPSTPPSDAIVLFDGKDLSEWVSTSGDPAAWKVENGYMEVVAKTGSIRTRREFGDCQLFVEWSAPDPPSGEGQGRGNSGVFLMGRYEVQVLDSYQNVTYPDGQAAALYGQYPPLVNASKPPGQWQTYNIIFRRPHFDGGGKVTRPARVTVLHNGVLVQDNVDLTGPTTHQRRPPYEVHPDRLPISLQDHGDPVRYRRIWIRELPEE